MQSLAQSIPTAILVVTIILGVLLAILLIRMLQIRSVRSNLARELEEMVG